jgi:protein involved in polysaccharide export with SLBB domain
VLGAVRSPGVYRTNSAKNVLEAIALCGGALPEADLREVHLTRPSGPELVSYQLDLRGYLYDARPLANFELQAGDIVTVPAGKAAGNSFLDFLVKLTPVISLVSAVVGLAWAVHL